MSQNPSPSNELINHFTNAQAPYYAWAEERGLLAIAERIRIILGLYAPSNNCNITSLVQELTYPESLLFLPNWIDHPAVDDLYEFAKAAHSSPFVTKHYPATVISGTINSIKKAFSKTTDTHYLLSLIASPIGNANILDRRKLRVWLIAQNYERLVKAHYHADQNIKYISRYLLLGPTDAKWEFVDAVLQEINRIAPAEQTSYGIYTYLIKHACINLLNSASLDLEHGQKVFLSHLQEIAEGNNAPIQSFTNTIPSLLRQTKRVQLPSEHSTFQTDDGDSVFILDTQQIVDVESISEGIDDDTEELRLVEVSNLPTEPQKLLSSNSVFLQSAEAAHYLPWSFDKILPGEELSWSNWIKSKLSSSIDIDALGASFCWLAENTGRSLEQVPLFSITNDAKTEWSLSEDFTRLHKISSRRQQAWKPQQHQYALIAPFTEAVYLEIPQQVTNILQRASKTLVFKALSLQDLWMQLSPLVSPESWLTQSLPQDLSRISSGKLSSSLAQKAFNKTGDYNLARNLSAHHKSGLPSACGYSAWQLKDVQKAIPLPYAKPTFDLNSETYLLGSRLIPSDTLLQKKIFEAHALIEQSSSLLEYHNRLCQYIVAALYSATGCRYLQEPFESIDFFDLESGYLYINDKSDDGLHDGRLVPLSLHAINLVKRYLQHLTKLAAYISQSNSMLANSVRKLTQGGDTDLPLFFLLDNNMQWQSMNALGIAGAELFDWELPKNVFRHRYAQQLQKHGIPTEVIDGWMGHAERNVVTYGDYSPRCWIKDAQQYRPSLETMANELLFPLIEHKDLSSLTHIQTQTLNNSNVKARLFGQNRRQVERQKKIEAATQNAHDEINTFLQNRRIEELEQEDIRVLINLMLSPKGNIGHPYATLRFNILKNKFINANASNIKYIHRHPIQGIDERLSITPEIIQAVKCMPLLTQWANNIDAIGNCKSKSKAALFAALLLCIQKRISYAQMIIDVANGSNYRLVQHKRQCFIEYSEDLEYEDYSAAVQRHEISYQIASLLNYAHSGIKELKIDSCLQINDISELKRLLNINEDTTLDDLISSVCSIVNQANLIELPGMVAAVLSGRVLSTSLPIQDYIRASEQKKRSHLKESITSESNVQDWVNPFSGRFNKIAKDELKENSEAFKKEIHSKISQYTTSNAKRTADEIECLCKSNEGSVGHSILLIGHWIVSVIRKGQGKGKKFIPFAQSSIETYFSSLITPFMRLAVNTDIRALDDEELTDLYSSMIDYKLLSDKKTDYFGDRLYQFHQWTRRIGIAEPDWSELKINDNKRKVRAGILTEKEYLECLDVLSARFKKSNLKTMLCMVLLLCYRFGLRLNEALGIQAKDWCEANGLTWILIQKNQHRSLKSIHSKRAVPLLFPLQEIEQKIVKNTFDRYQSLMGEDKKHLLLGELINGKVEPNQQAHIISPTIIAVMREVTGSSNVVLHHARHTFHNKIASLLLDIESPSALKLASELNKEKIKELILGSQHSLSRRIPMAIARLMGHAHPITGMLNYNHLLIEWADTLTPVHSPRVAELESAFQTDSMERYKTPKSAKKQDKKNSEPSLADIFKALRLVSLGRSFEPACLAAGLPMNIAKALEATFFNASHKMMFKKRGELKLALGSDQPFMLLKYITDSAWVRLIEKAQEITPSIHTNKDLKISLDYLPNLVGPNRQLLMEKREHFHLVKACIDLFSVSADDYRIAMSKEHDSLVNLLNSISFNAVEISSSRIDAFNEYDGTTICGKRKIYASLIIDRVDEGTIRNSNELAVAFLSIAILLQFV